MKTKLGFRNLGKQIAFYRCHPLRKRDWLRQLAASGFAIFVPLFYGTYRADFAYNQYGPAAARSWALPWFLFSFLVLLISAILLLIRIIKSRQAIAVHERGLRFFGRPIRSLSWPQLAGIATDRTREQFLGFQLQSMNRLILFPGAGKLLRFEFSDEDFSELVTRIKACLYPRLLPLLSEDYQAGRRIWFGPVSIHNTGLQVNKRDIPWSQVRQLQIQSGELVVELNQSPGLRLPISWIPNLELLLQLIKQGESA